MKKQLFSLVMMLALVIVAGTAMAQSTYNAPYVGAQQIYKWSSVTAASYTYAVTTSLTSPTSSQVAPGTIYTVSAGSLTPPAGALAAATSADLGLKWLTPAVGNTYYVWLVAMSADGCENWRYVTVKPEANQVDFVLAALGLYTKAEAITTLNTASAVNGGNACPTPTLRDGAVYDSNSSADGDVYAYFRVSQGADNNDVSWTFDFSASAGSVEYYNGSAWVAYTSALTGISDNAVQLLRVKIPTPIATNATATAITGTMTAASEETTGLLDSKSDNDVQVYTVKRVAAIGGFSGN